MIPACRNLIFTDKNGEPTTYLIQTIVEEDISPLPWGHYRSQHFSLSQKRPRSPSPPPFNPIVSFHPAYLHVNNEAGTSNQSASLTQTIPQLPTSSTAAPAPTPPSQSITPPSDVLHPAPIIQPPPVIDLPPPRADSPPPVPEIPQPDPIPQAPIPEAHDNPEEIRAPIPNPPLPAPAAPIFAPKRFQIIPEDRRFPQLQTRPATVSALKLRTQLERGNVANQEPVQVML